MQIRKATRADIKSISDISVKTYLEAFEEFFTPEELEQKLELRSEDFYTKVFDQDTILLAEEDGAIVGYVQFGDVTFDYDGITNNDQELQRLYVLKKYQNKGIGKALMSVAIQDSRLIIAPKVYIEVSEENISAQRFYESCGFEEVVKIGINFILVKNVT